MLFKTKWMFFVICCIIVFSGQVVFGSENTPIDYEGDEDNIISSESGAITVVLDEYESKHFAIRLRGDAVAVIDANVTEISLAGNIISSTNVITLNGNTDQKPSLTILSEELTITNNTVLGSVMMVSHASLTANGNIVVVSNVLGNGVQIIGGSSVDFRKDLSITMSSYNSPSGIFGLILAADAKVNINGNLLIETTGHNNMALGIVLGESGSFEVAGNTSITTAGDDSIGIIFGNSGNTLLNGNVDIKTSGDYSFGIQLNRIMDNVIFNGDLKISTTGLSSNGISVYDDDGVDLPARQKAIIVKGGVNIHTEGKNASAIILAEVKADFGTNTTAESKLATTGDESVVLYAYDSIVTFGKVDISSKNSLATDAHAIVGFGESTMLTFIGDTTVSTVGISSDALVLSYGANAKFLKDVTMNTKGNDANGIVMNENDLEYISSVVFEGKANISTSGDGGHGVIFNTLSKVLFKGGGVITTSGADAYALFFGSKMDSGSTSGFQKPDSKAARSFVFNDMTLQSDSGIVVFNSTENEAILHFTGKSEILGNVFNAKVDNKYGSVLLVLEDQSVFSGNSGNALGEGAVNLELYDSSYWLVLGDYRMDNIYMANNSEIRFEYIDESRAYHTATVGKLTGTGTLVLNVNATDDFGKADYMQVGEASGIFKLKVVYHGDGENIATVIPVIEVLDSSDGFDISLYQKKNLIKMGSEYYKLQSEVVGDSTIWQLVLKDIRPEVVESTNTSMIGLFKFAKAVDASISDELLSDKNIVWLLLDYKEQNYIDLPTNDDLNQKIVNLVVGLDFLSFGSWDFGILVGFSRAKQEVSELIVSTTSSASLGLSASYSGNGLIVSGYVRVANYLHKLEVIDDANLLNGAMNTTGISASVQAMKSLYISNTGIFVSPKAKISFVNIFEFEHDFEYLNVTGKNASSFIVWLGSRIGFDFAIENVFFTPYIEAGFSYDTNPMITIFVDEETEFKLDAESYEIGMGLDIRTSKSSAFTFEYRFATSENLIEPIKIKFAATIVF